MKSKTRRLLAILAGLGVLGLGMALRANDIGAPPGRWKGAVLQPLGDRPDRWLRRL